MKPSVGAICGVVLLTCLARQAHSAPAESPGRYGAAAREVMDYAQRTFWDEERGVYVKSAKDRTPDYVWREAAAFSALVGATRHEPDRYGPIMKRFFKSLDRYWDDKVAIPAYEPAPTRGNGNDKYYDDNAWLVITFLEAYELTGEKPYLTRATETAWFVASGWDDQLGGGIWWHQLHKDGTKNTCANAPAAVGYFRLARLGPADQADAWANAAEKAVKWTREKLQANDGLYDDRIVVATGEVKKGKLTYNSALMLRAELELYRRTGRPEHLDEAKRIGNAAEWFIDRRTGMYRDPLKWSHFMIEADLELHRATGDERFLRRAQTNADAYCAAWKERPPEDMMSNLDIARVLWLLADTETAKGRSFWEAAEKKPGHGT